MKITCQQCGGPAVLEYKIDNKVLRLCIDCNLKYQQALDIQVRRNAEMLNYLAGQIEMSVGIPGFIPRYQITPSMIHHGEIKLNNISVSNSTVGAINTGNVRSIDVSLSVIKQLGNHETVAAIKELTEAVLKSNDLLVAQKDEILDQLAFITDQLSQPKEKRRQSLLKPILIGIASTFSSINSLLAIWEKVKPILEKAL